MNKTIDLTEFYVSEYDETDNSYVVLKRDFDTMAEAVDFESKIENAVSEQGENGIFKKCELYGYPLAYIPLIKVKAEDYYEAYDEDGTLIDEKPEIIEQLVAVCETTVLANPYRRTINDPATLQIKMTIGIPMDLFDEMEKEKITITCV